MRGSSIPCAPASVQTTCRTCGGSGHVPDPFGQPGQVGECPGCNHYQAVCAALMDAEDALHAALTALEGIAYQRPGAKDVHRRITELLAGVAVALDPVAGREAA